MTDTGHIYKIICLVEPTFCYIGSTFNRLSKRFEKHRVQFKAWLKDKSKHKCACYPYYEKYNIENFKIILIKSYEVSRSHVKDRKHLEAYETLWINRHKNKCCNVKTPINYLKKEKRKKYLEENKEKLAEQQKEYREDNKEKRKEYREKNKEQISEQTKGYYDKNKEKIAEKRKEKVQCECGYIVSRNNLSSHKKRQIHKDLMAQK